MSRAVLECQVSTPPLRQVLGRFVEYLSAPPP
jgi:hypothetical protein